MDIKDLLFRYGVVAGRRFYTKEKLRFLRGAAQEFLNGGFTVDIKEAKKNQRKAFNLYIGNMEKSKFIISSYYDTPPKTFNLIKHEVFSPKNDYISFLIASLIPLILIILFGSLFINFILQPIFLDNIFNFSDILVFIPIFFLIFLLYRYRNGFGNQSNIIRNTSSVIASIKIAEELKNNLKSKIGFAFTDFGCINHFGDMALKLKTENNINLEATIFLDCIGSSDEIIILYTKNCKSIISNIKDENKSTVVFKEINFEDKKYYNIFDKSIIVTSGKLSDDVVKIDKVNTNKDNDFNEENINKVIELVTKLIS